MANYEEGGRDKAACQLTRGADERRLADRDGPEVHHLTPEGGERRVERVVLSARECRVSQRTECEGNRDKGQGTHVEDDEVSRQIMLDLGRREDLIEVLERES